MEYIYINDIYYDQLIYYICTVLYFIAIDSKLKQADEDINLLKNDRNLQKKQLEEYKRLLDTNVIFHQFIYF